MILGLTKKIDSTVTDTNKKRDTIVTDMSIIKTDVKTDKMTLTKKMDNIEADVNMIKTDKMHVTEMNRVADQVINRATENFDERLKGMSPLDKDPKECVECAK